MIRLQSVYRQLNPSFSRALFTHTVSCKMSTNSTIYDLIVIGAGSGGLGCARRAAKHGAKVLLTENGICFFPYTTAFLSSANVHSTVMSIID